MNIEIEDDGEQMDLIVPENNLPAVTQDAMMMRVIEGGNVDALEKFIALREREESRQASLEFDRHFAEMQAEFPAIKRLKNGHNYKYAPIEVLQKTLGPIIAKHGFSYRWEESPLETGKRVTIIISGHGASRNNSFDVPNIQGTSQNNEIQVGGIMSSYGRRYSLISGFGVIIEDEDPDGMVKQQAPQGDSVEEWERLWLSRVDALATDDGHRAKLTKAVKAAAKSGSHAQAKKVMDEIKAANDGS